MPIANPRYIQFLVWEIGLLKNSGVELGYIVVAVIKNNSVSRVVSENVL